MKKIKVATAVGGVLFFFALWIAAPPRRGPEFRLHDGEVDLHPFYANPDGTPNSNYYALFTNAVFSRSGRR